MPENVPVFSQETTCGSPFTSVSVTIHAEQWDGTEEHARKLTKWADSYRGRGSAVYIEAKEPVELNFPDQPTHVLESPAHIAIGTLEGIMKLHKGDWLIRGTEDEFYPCKDSVFQRKYRPAATVSDSTSIQLQRHEYAENSFELHHFTGKLLLGREDLEELYRQLDDFLYPNPGFEPRIAEAPRG
jgi:hypothetical protein